MINIPKYEEDFVARDQSVLNSKLLIFPFFLLCFVHFHICTQPKRNNPRLQADTLRLPASQSLRSSLISSVYTEIISASLRER